jgi:hypothetical protein
MVSRLLLVLFLFRLGDEGTMKGRDVTWMLQHGKGRRKGGEREEKERRKEEKALNR